jgi:hypothetical protein
MAVERAAWLEVIIAFVHRQHTSVNIMPMPAQTLFRASKRQRKLDRRLILPRQLVTGLLGPTLLDIAILLTRLLLALLNTVHI